MTKIERLRLYLALWLMPGWLVNILYEAMEEKVGD